MIAVQTLFAREHNRLVSLLPDWVPPEDKFQIARAVVIAEQQWITYNEFLPTMGVTLPPYSGFKSSVNTGIVSEFSAVGYRAHTMVPYTVGVETEVSRYSAAQLAAFRAGEYFEFHNTVAVTGGKVKITVPIPIAFFNPDMLEDLGLGPVLQGLSLTPGHAIDSRLIANPVRSAHFALPGAATCNPQRLQQRIEGHITTPVGCSLGVNDLAATDLVRGRDQGMPSYNEFRAAYGLAPKTSFTAITGEATGEFPAGTGIDDPHSLDFVALYDVHGNRTTAQAGDAVRGVQRAPLAARLKAIYHSVDNLEAFAGATAETSVVGSDLGETQWTSWQRQYTALRDGDRFFYANNPALPFIKRQFGIDYRKSLGDLIALNTDIPRHEMASNVFLTPEAQ
jgi:hypothetical protein